MGSKASRNTSIEALRLVAVAGIAIFHTFQWTFQAVCTGLPEYAPLAVFPYSGALGFINLLGCWANEVFFMISGYFLIPSAVRALQNGSSAPDLARKSLARLKKIVLPTLFYCAACLLISMYVYPLPEISLHEMLAYAGHRVYLGLRRLRIARPSDCVDTTANRQHKGPVCRSTPRARNIWNQLLHRGDGKRSCRCRFVAQAHERRYLPGRVYCSWRNAVCPRIPRQRIRLSEIQDRAYRTYCRHRHARAPAIDKQPVRRALEALLQVNFRHILHLSRCIRCRRSAPSATPRSPNCRQDNRDSRRRNARFLRRTVVHLQRLATHLRQSDLHHGDRHPNGRAPSSRRHFARNPYEPLPRAFPAPRGYRAQGRSRDHQSPHERLSDLLTPQTTKRAYTRSK